MDEKSSTLKYIGVVPSYTYFLWLIFGLTFSFLPFLIYYILTPYNQLIQYLNIEDSKVFFYTIIILVLFLYQLVKYYYSYSYNCFLWLSLGIFLPLMYYINFEEYLGVDIFKKIHLAVILLFLLFYFIKKYYYKKHSDLLWFVSGLLSLFLPLFISSNILPFPYLYNFLNTVFFKVIILGVIVLLPLWIYLIAKLYHFYQSYKNNINVKSGYFTFGFDQKHTYLIMAIGFSLVFIFISYASMSGHLLNNVCSSFLYTEKFITVYSCVSLITLFVLFLILYFSNLLFIPYPKVNNHDKSKIENSSLKSLILISCPSRPFLSNYIPARYFRELDDYSQAIERLCLYLIFVKEQYTKKKKVIFEPLKVAIIFIPIWLPFIILALAGTYNLYSGINADEKFKLIIWSSLSSWGIFSVTYYHWVIRSYLEPLYLRNDRENIRVEIDDFDFESLGIAMTNSFKGSISSITQFILLTAVAALLVYFSYIAY